MYKLERQTVKSCHAIRVEVTMTYEVWGGAEDERIQILMNDRCKDWYSDIL